MYLNQQINLNLFRVVTTWFHPQQDKLVCLAKLLDTSPGQMRYGRSSEKTMVLSNGNLESEISNTDQEFFVRYLKLDESRKRLTRDVVIEFSNSESNR